MQFGRRLSAPVLGAILLLVGLVTLGGIVGMTFWLAERAQVIFSELSVARETRVVAVDLRDAVQSAESSQRGYLLTGNEIYLAPFTTALARAQRALGQLESLLSAQPQTRPAMERLVAVLGDKFAEMEDTIALKRARSDDAALLVIRTNRGKALMDEANVFFSGFIAQSEERVAAGLAEQRVNADLLRVTTLFGGLVIILVVGLAAFTGQRYLRELRDAQVEVLAANAALEERVRERTANLVAMNDEIQRFAYIVTHDLRAPLVNIMGFTSELEHGLAALKRLVAEPSTQGNSAAMTEARQAIDEDFPEAIGFIRSSTAKMDGLISAILTISREGRRSLRPETVDVEALVAGTARALQHQLSDAGGEVAIDVDLPEIVTDRLSLEQVAGNLLDNALKYRDPKRPLRIKITGRIVDAATVGLDIADNGRGIADHDRERIFELFRRSGPQDTPGEGIGLAFVRAVMRNLGGEVTVSSILGTGSVFHLVLPRALPDASA